MSTFNLITIIISSSFILHGIYLLKLKNYLKKAHKSKWEDLTPETLMGIHREDVDIGNYFKEIKFVFTSDNLNDALVTSLKWKIRVLLTICLSTILFGLVFDLI